MLRKTHLLVLWLPRCGLVRCINAAHLQMAQHRSMRHPAMSAHKGLHSKRTLATVEDAQGAWGAPPVAQLASAAIPEHKRRQMLPQQTAVAAPAPAQAMMVSPFYTVPTTGGVNYGWWPVPAVPPQSTYFSALDGLMQLGHNAASEMPPTSDTTAAAKGTPTTEKTERSGAADLPMSVTAASAGVPAGADEANDHKDTERVEKTADGAQSSNLSKTVKDLVVGSLSSTSQRLRGRKRSVSHPTYLESGLRRMAAMAWQRWIDG